MPRLTRSPLCALLLTFAACGQLEVTIGGEGAPKADDAVLQKQDLTLGSRVHKLPWRDPAALQTAAAPSGAHLTYYGGKIIPNVKVYSVNWGAGVNATISSGMPGFYAALTASNQFTWLGEYSTTGLNGADGQPGSNQALGHGTFNGTITITPSITGTSLTDSQIQSELNAQIAAGVLPAPDDSTFFAINFPVQYSISQGGSSSCSAGGFCAYHGTFLRGSQDVYYSVLPSTEPGSGCNAGCGSSSSFFDNYTSVSSHELVEAVTDAEVGIGTTVGRPLAWYDSSNGEIGDICNASQGTITDASGTVYTVQAEFDNATSNCVVTKAVTTPPDFTIALASPSASVTQGASTTVTVHTTNVAGSPSVALAVSGLPAGVTGSFSPASVTAGGSATLTLSASAAAAVGAATFTVTGTATGATHATSGSLTVASSGTGGGAGGGSGGGAGGGSGGGSGGGTGGGTGETVLANGVAVTGQSGALNAQAFYRVDVPAGASSLTISISGGTGDADLYTRFGARPTLTAYDCRPYLTGNNESCTVAAPAAGSYYVMLNGYAAYAGLSLTASWSTGGTVSDPVLSVGVPIGALSSAAGSQKFWQVTVPSGTSRLVVSITGSSAASNDADLYLRFGAHPSTSAYDCRPYLVGSNESCTVNAPPPGTYYVMLRGYTAYSGVTLKAQ